MTKEKQKSSSDYIWKSLFRFNVYIIENYEKIIFVCYYIMFICMAADIITKHSQYPWYMSITRPFSDTFSTFESAIFMVWTFTTSLLIFYLGRIEVKHYGIKITDLLLLDYSLKQMTAYLTVILAEFIVMLLASLFTLTITILITGIINIVTMVIVFIIICLVNSEFYVTEKIKIDTLEKLYKNKLSPLFIQMLHSFDLNNKQEIQTLTNFLDDVCRRTQCSNTNSADTSADFLIFYFKEFTTYLLNLLHNSWEREQMVRILLTDLESASAKNGVLAGFLDSIEEHPDLQLEYVLDIEFEHKTSVLIYGLTYNGYLTTQGYANQNYRIPLSRKLRNRINFSEESSLCISFFERWIHFFQKNAPDDATQNTSTMKEQGKQNFHWDIFWNLLYPDWRQYDL